MKEKKKKNIMLYDKQIPPLNLSKVYGLTCDSYVILLNIAFCIKIERCYCLALIALIPYLN